MGKETRDNKGHQDRGRPDRILYGSSKSGRRRTRKIGALGRSIEQACKEWNLYEPGFLTRCDEYSFVLKIKALAHDEEIHTEVWTQHGNNISLLRVQGRSAKFNRERLLGYILLHAGRPTSVHAHTWYVAIAYSDEDDIRRKDPEPLKSDDHVRLYKAGIGKFDYLFCYKARTKEHDEAGFSDGAAHLETADQWRDGL